MESLIIRPEHSATHLGCIQISGWPVERGVWAATKHAATDHLLQRLGLVVVEGHHVSPMGRVPGHRFPGPQGERESLQVSICGEPERHWYRWQRANSETVLDMQLEELECFLRLLLH